MREQLTNWIKEYQLKPLIKHLSRMGGFSQEVSVLKLERNATRIYKNLGLKFDDNQREQQVQEYIATVSSILQKANPS